MDTTLEATRVWEQVLKKLEQELSKLAIDTWLRPTVPLKLTETTLEIGTPKQITKEWLESRYLPIILPTVHYIANKSLEVIFINLEVEDNVNKNGHREEQIASTRPVENIYKERISVSLERQITIPIGFHQMLQISNEVDCYAKNGNLIIEPIRHEYSGGVAEEILKALIAQGLSEEELLSKFREMSQMIRPIELINTHTDAIATTNEKDNFSLSSPIVRRPNDEPYYIPKTCEKCKAPLIYRSEIDSTNWQEDELFYDEFMCPVCKDGIYLDIPKTAREKLLRGANTPLNQCK